MEAGKEEFLKEFGEGYGYPNAVKSIDQIRATEFRRLDQNGTVYLDHAGATLYSELQMEEVLKDLTSTVYGNPHSQSDSSSATTEIIREARQQTLEFCNASPKDYSCIFTSGATAALKLVGEAFPWSSSSTFMYTMENHNSVLGIREYALNQGAASVAVDIEDPPQGVSGSNASSATISHRPVQRRNAPSCVASELTDEAYNLFAFPSECNFSGLRFGLDLVKLVKDESERFLPGSSFSKGRWMVLIDAAKGSVTKPPDLSKYPADFVVISFYKLFGYPTGLGALIVQNGHSVGYGALVLWEKRASTLVVYSNIPDAAKVLQKTYFSGGTVATSFADADFVRRRDSIEELFEDGSASFLSIASIRYGFKVINFLTTPAISRHIACLTNYVKKVLLSLRHWNGVPVCELYGSASAKVLCSNSGTIMSFNLKRPDNSWVGYREVEKLASLSGIQLRTGCFCNPGACAKYLGLSHQDLLSNLEAGHICWDDNDIMQGKPTGAVRISFGYMSTYEDAKKFIDLITASFVSESNECGMEDLVCRKLTPLLTEATGMETYPAGCYLKSITVYPIKSCGGFNVERWPLSTTGLLYDREWMITSVTGEVLTQKKVLEMCLISTSIDLVEGVMHVESPRCMSKLHINLATDIVTERREEIDLYAQRYEVKHHEADVNAWFSSAIGRSCILLRLASSKCFSCLNKSTGKGICRDVIGKLNFANEAQFLLIMEESVADLNKRLSSRNAQKSTLESRELVNPMRFRPNFVISGGKPYAEDGWKSIKIGSTYFVSIGGCNRCQMINHVHQSGNVSRSNEPLATLASYRRIKGKIFFGILLRHEMADKPGQQQDSWLQVGQEVQPYFE